jgi:hypothetical protein
MTGGNMSEPNVELAPDVEPGMASMLADMIKTNLKDKPDRVKDFNKLRGTIWITAEDADTEMTMVFEGGKLMVHSGKVGTPILEISTDASTLMDLANIDIKFGMPYYFDETGRMVIKKLLKKELKIKGMFAHTMALTRMTKIMSVK